MIYLPFLNYLYRNFTHIALRPTTTQMVAAIMKHCYKRNLAVVPQGGNTGLVGGGTPVFDEIVLSTSLMDDIINFDPQSGILICQAGCILKNLQDYVGNYGFTMPIDLGARGSCQIGGNLSTNAGGIHFVRYGPLRRYVTGVEVVVLSNGVVLDMITPQPMQDSDFKQLFIGAEGTLAILTKVAIKCVETAKCYSAIMLGCKTHHQVTSVLMDARNVLGHTVSAIEVMDSAAVSVVDSKLGLKCPLSPHPFYALIETFSNDEDQNIDKLSHILSLLENKFGSMESAVSLNQTQLSQLWSVREHITEALKRDGHVYKFDISVPIAKYFDLVDVMRHEIGSYSSTICGFGHLADGNLHLNITSKQYDKLLLNRIETILCDWLVQNGGSISAEHGIGFHKAHLMHGSKSSNSLAMMRSIKAHFDPKNILNPYKVVQV
ncbi:uncharacterized protein TRIADDRAFT_31230 [Trichoplax adhaerens]|uniref:D-2-hydroxyglutarate dehydrogenase, mitochondrial n=1 Tax=Trichoplax adhaerens TaxID=10228 RepID=B3S946_TRIAD|nr:hypothetical protein TRIADDRAFT_31230 [Trichoplax adhaerens]EDV20810.1 hypothetical protein TRIADDRAFT_31230 [Trichoplax adhaerens]|eukprot:XP_002116751.1 hypothetical protein TRIADDRAFT_31230 [Trichoplax adhaerens]